MAFATLHRLVVLSMIPILVLFLISGLYISSRGTDLVSHGADRINEILHPGDPEFEDEDFATGEPEDSEWHQPESAESQAADASKDSESEDAEASESSRLPEYAAGKDALGKFLHVRPSPPTKKGSGFKGCQYPIVIHVTPDEHCTGALTLYGSVVRNVLMQPSMLQGKTCVHVTYVDPELKTIEEMWKWTPKKNPFTHVKDCAALDSTPALNKVVPIRFQSLPQIEKPAIMDSPKNWLAALNKIHSWAFDLYPRILLLDADSFIITDLALIFDETPEHYTIAAAADQYFNCGDRTRFNGGMVLLRPSRYFQMSALELVYDPDGSCSSGKWGQSEQELLNCMCGGNGPPRGTRPEFPCLIMPLYNSVWPPNFGCSGANVVPMRSIHMTVATKPWKIDDSKLHLRFDYAFWGCVRDASRKGDQQALQECHLPPPEVTRLVTYDQPPNELIVNF
ncbi:LPXTG-motif cell wall anchor domain protein [Diplocarpon rosae]|nr:LPXTG-motif cell wall anchor domain protein [Diplocarpon rosae]